MTFKLGSFFPKQPINEPPLDLNDPNWERLEGGYKGPSYDASIALRQLQGVSSLKQAKPIFDELWNNLHHQGDIGVASLYAVPHLVRIAKDKGLIDWNVLGLVTLIEVQRSKCNLTIPSKLKNEYEAAIGDLSVLSTSVLTQS
ncbi:hypothetical protein ABIB62_003781 [Mucilaginibacter sp. UYP25]|uniref:hypothetical protein n=1 Tax=unclassified Mucilaginibacter TaxID=2617802 RepID=UPI0033958D93